MRPSTSPASSRSLPPSTTFHPATFRDDDDGRQVLRTVDYRQICHADSINTPSKSVRDTRPALQHSRTEPKQRSSMRCFTVAGMDGASVVPVGLSPPPRGGCYSVRCSSFLVGGLR